MAAMTQSSALGKCIRSHVMLHCHGNLSSCRTRHRTLNASMT